MKLLELKIKMLLYVALFNGLFNIFTDEFSIYVRWNFVNINVRVIEIDI